MLFDGRGREGDGHRQAEYDARMTQRKKEPDAQRLLTLLQHITNGIVYRRDMIGVESMTQPEQISDDTESDQGRVARRIVHIQAPPEDVEKGDETVEAAQTRPFAGGEDRQRAARLGLGRRIGRYGNRFIVAHGISILRM